MQLLAAANYYTRICYYSLSLGAKIQKMGISWILISKIFFGAPYFIFYIRPCTADRVPIHS